MTSVAELKRRAVTDAQKEFRRQEILDGGDINQGNFAQSARVQEIINAVTLSHRKHRWIDLPLPADSDAPGQQSPY